VADPVQRRRRPLPPKARETLRKLIKEDKLSDEAKRKIGALGASFIREKLGIAGRPDPDIDPTITDFEVEDIS